MSQRGRSWIVFLWIFTENCILIAACCWFEHELQQRLESTIRVSAYSSAMYMCLLPTVAFLIRWPDVPNQIPAIAHQLNDRRLNPLTPELNLSAQRCLTRFLLGILLLEPRISLTYAWKTNKYTNHSFSLLIMYGSSYMFQHYIAILRKRS
jgi:hypothetical protein